MIDQSANKVAEHKWRSSFTDEEKDLVEAAEKLHAVLPPLGATYRAALFLQLYLSQHHAITGNVVVGFINDGQDNIYRSNAWLVYEGQVTDLAAARLHGSDAGAVLIHGFALKPGKKWNYHKSRPSGSLIEVQELRPAADDRAAIEEAEEMHLYMGSVARDMRAIRNYLDQAPDKMNYEAMCELMR